MEDQPIGDQMQHYKNSADMLLRDINFVEEAVSDTSSIKHQPAADALSPAHEESLVQMRNRFDNMEEEGRLWLDQCLPTFRQNS